MAKNEYKGKRIVATFPLATYERVKIEAEKLTRTEAGTVVWLVELALRTLDKEP